MEILESCVRIGQNRVAVSYTQTVDCGLQKKERKSKNRFNARVNATHREAFLVGMIAFFYIFTAYKNDDLR